MTSKEFGLKCQTVGSTLVMYRYYFLGFFVFDEIYQTWQDWNYLNVPRSGTTEYYPFMID